MRFLRRSLVGLFLLSLTVGILAVAGSSVYGALKDKWARESSERPRRERVFAVNVVTAQAADVVPILTAFGEMRSQRVLDVRATAAGVIIDLAAGFVEGGVVETGAFLARIDPQNAQSALDRAEADISEAKAEITDARRAIVLAQDDVTSALDQAMLRAAALKRQQNLLSRGVGTDAAVEAATLARASANQVVLSKRSVMQKSEARLTQASTRLKRQEVNLAEAKRRLADTEIYAAFRGTLGNVTVTKGGVVTSNERLAQLVDDRALEVSFRVSTSQYVRLLDQDGELTNAPVEVVLDVFGVDVVSSGIISREGAEVGEGQTGRLLFARMDTPRGFRPGDFVTVRIKEPVIENAIVLPASAIDAAQTVLLIGAEERLESVAIEVLRKQGDDVVVRGTQVEGREVVMQRSPLLGAGIKVRVLRPDAEVAQAPEMLTLTRERREKLIAFIEGSQQMPAEAKARVLAQLAKDNVPARVVARIEARMGG